MLYDGDCSFCSGFARRAEAAGKGRLEPVPFQDEARVRSAAPGLEGERLRSSFHLVLPTGEVLSGPDAVPALAALLLPGGRLLAWVLRRAPGSRALTKAAYRWISEHRW